MWEVQIGNNDVSQIRRSKMNRRLKTDLGVCKVGNYATVTATSADILIYVGTALIGPYSSKLSLCRTSQPHSSGDILMSQLGMLVFVHSNNNNSHKSIMKKAKCDFHWLWLIPVFMFLP